ncbi:MAG: chemotaxis protein CheW [Pseudomonadota bacterium]
MFDDDTQISGEQVDEEDEVTEQLVFRMGDSLVSIPVLYVREILDRTPYSVLPRAPHHVLGMIDVRGTMIAVLDFAQKMGAAPMQEHPGSRIVVLEFEQDPTVMDVHALEPQETQLIAILTDGVVAVTALDAADVQQIPPIGELWNSDFILGVAKLDGTPVIRLDLQCLFGDEQPLLFNMPAAKSA